MADRQMDRQGDRQIVKTPELCGISERNRKKLSK